ncbi:MAG TPA: metallophosphoesterase [Bryobacteraceae bacterium]|nr:metallophosphoesterase [Bryobacteraceae bacterium]
MTQTHFGGIVEYAATILLIAQILLARRWLKGRSLAVWLPLIAIWIVTAAAIATVWSGAMYSMRRVPVTIRVGFAATGYIWIFLTSLAAAAFLLGRYLLRKTPAAHSPGRRRALGGAALLAAAAPASVVAYGAFVERNDYGVTELDFPVRGLHPDLDGYRIMQVSDLHVSPFLSVRQMARVIDMANDLRADLSVFTGDLITEPGDPLNAAIRELVRLRAPDGVLGCMGNHEAYVGCRNYLERQARPGGVDFLRMRARQVRRGQGVLNIAGVDYQRNDERAHYLEGTEKLIVPGVTNLLLSHNPDVFPASVRIGFDGVLAGHTHGGQINVEILHQDINPARFRTPFTKGLYRWGLAGAAPGTCYVTNGVGTIGMPIRLGAPPEIALLRLRRA